MIVKMKTLFVYVTLIFISNSYSQNWQSVTSNTTSEIKDMYFQNETVGFAVPKNMKFKRG